MVFTGYSQGAVNKMWYFFLANGGWHTLDGLKSEVEAMTQHPSFTRGGAATRRRNVLKRHERVDLLKKRRRWSGESSIVGMPKTQPEA
jgi:small basic protein (TIGR04137 family)